jgi:type IV secretion system protein VirB4
MTALIARTLKPDAAREAPAGARLPYARQLDDVTLETRDGRLLQVIRLAGYPFETADTEALNYRKTVRDTMLRGVASAHFALYHHVVRREASSRLEGQFPDPFSQALDGAWRERLASRRLYVNELFLTLVRRPLQGSAGLWQGALKALSGARGAVHEQAALGRAGALRRAAAERL